MDVSDKKEELLQLLDKYKGILNKGILEYLSSLIELEFSVIRENINPNDRECLCQLELYKRIAIYNIYQRALDLISKSGIMYSFNDKEDMHLQLSTQIHNRILNLFDFNYAQENYIISLYQTLNNKKVINAEIKRIRDQIRKIEDTLRHLSKSRIDDRDFYYESKKELERAQKRLSELTCNSKLDKTDKLEIEITNYIRDLLLEDYGIAKSEFEDKTNYNYKKLIQPKVVQIHGILNIIAYPKEQDFTKKTLVKKVGNITIENQIKYM